MTPAGNPIDFVNAGALIRKPSDKNQVNSNIPVPGLDTVNFDIPGAGPHTIQPLSLLPAIEDSVLIDGYTQPGASANTQDTGLGINAALMIELDGRTHNIMICTCHYIYCIQVNTCNTVMET